MRNGYVYTVDDQNSVQQTIAISGGKIVYVGSDAGIDAYIGKQTQLIDLAGRMLMPGFVDAHMHPGDGCLLYTSPSPRDGLLSRMPSSA